MPRSAYPLYGGVDDSTSSVASKEVGMIDENIIKSKALHINSLMYSLKFSVIEEIKEMYRGGNPDGIKTFYYQGWEKSDFGNLLNLIIQEEE